MSEQLEDKTKELTKVQDNLHLMNKARHDLEIKLEDENKRNANLIEQNSMKDDQLEKRQQEINDLEKQVQELTRQNGDIEIKKQGIERQFEMAKKQLNERISNLNEVINGEKETRDLWIDRYEKEQKAHNETQNSLLQTNSDLKDQQLAVKNGEIKLNTANRQIQALTEQNVKFQHQVNEAIARAENLDRELSTQKEILKQMELTKKEYIEKLKKELDLIEVRYQHLLNENSMIGEDFRSRAIENLTYARSLEKTIDGLKENIKDLNGVIDNKDMEIVGWGRKVETYMMNLEEYLTYHELMRQDRDRIQGITDDLTVQGQLKDKEIKNLNEQIRQIEEAQAAGKIDKQIQTNIDYKFWQKKPESGRGSGAISTQRTMRSGQRVGGGGSIAKKPPQGGARRESRADVVSRDSRAGLQIDTTSSQND